MSESKDPKSTRDSHRYVDPQAPLDAEHRAALARLEPRLMGVEVRRSFHGKRGDVKIPGKPDGSPMSFDIAVADAAAPQDSESGLQSLVLFVDLVATGDVSAAAVNLVAHAVVTEQTEAQVDKMDRQALGAWAAPILYDTAANALRTSLAGSPATQEISVPLYAPHVRLHSLVRRKKPASPPSP